MVIVRDILSALELIAPTRFTFEFDRVGLQVGDLDREVQRAVVSMDRSLGAVRFAKESQAQLLLAHHPLIFHPIESVDSRTHVGRTILDLAISDISFVAAHTNWDSAPGGINDTLAEILRLTGVRAFGSGARTVDGSVEQPAGRIGALASQTTLSAFSAQIDTALATRCWVWGTPDRPISRVAVVGGSADDEWGAAKEAGADVLVTGEVKQHVALEASESGFAIVAAGHYATEHPGSAALRARVADAIREVEWLLFAPAPGMSGRPI